MRWIFRQENTSLVSQELLMKKVSSGRPSDKSSCVSQKKTVYRVKNWATYDQALVQRGSVTVWLSEEAMDGWHYAGPAQRGAQFVYSHLAIAPLWTVP